MQFRSSRLRRTELCDARLHPREFLAPMCSPGADVRHAFCRLMILGSGLGRVAEQQTEAMARRAENDPALQKAGIEMMLCGQGLKGTLRQMAAGVPGQRVDETTSLIRVEGDGTRLRYIYEVSTDAATIPISMCTGQLNQNCTYAALGSGPINRIPTRRDV